MESQDSIEDRAGILRGGEAAHSPFISVSSRRHRTSQASLCYQLAQSEGRDTKISLENSISVTISVGTTQLLSPGEEMATSPLPENTLDR